MHNRTRRACSTHAKVGEGFRLELVDTIAVPQWLYDAYIMGKEYGGHLTMTEQEKLADFKAQFDKYHLDNHDEEAQYCGTNEFDGMGGLCYDVDVYQRSNDEKCEAGSKFTNGKEAKGEDMDLKEFYKKFEEAAKKLLGEDLWEMAWTKGDPEQFAKELAINEFGPEEAAEEYAEMVQTMKEQGEFDEAKCEGEHECEWCVEYEDVWDNKECEKFPTEPEAWARYNELIARTHGDMADIVWVEEPKCPTCECGSSAASLGAVPTGGSQVKDEGKDEFLKDALYRINFDGDEEIIAKLVKDGEDFSLVALMPDGEAKAVMTADLFSVVDYCKELLDMDPEDAIIVIENA